MKARFRLVRRGSRRGVFYAFDTVTGKKTSLETTDKHEAQRLIHSKNEAHLQPSLNFQIARVYLSATDPEMRSRTWQTVMEAMADLKQGPTLVRWKTAMKDMAFDRIRKLLLLETRPEHLLEVLKRGTVSTNVFLRRMHNFALDMDWLPKTVIPRRLWPRITFKHKRAITAEEHSKIIAGERDTEWRAYYALLWEIGGSQSDVAGLHAEDVDRELNVICFSRQKTGSPVQLNFGPQLDTLLKSRPTSGLLFPNISRMAFSTRAPVWLGSLPADGLTRYTQYLVC